MTPDSPAFGPAFAPTAGQTSDPASGPASDSAAERTSRPTRGPARFFLMRHARTAWNAERRIQGQSDSPLTAEGEAQAGEWGWLLAASAAPPFDLLLVSDLGRAARTAALVNASLGLPMRVEPRLREQDWGEWVGRTVADLRGREGGPDLLTPGEALGWDFRPPGGESRRELLARARQALLDAATGLPGARILVVAHEGPIKALVYDLAGRSFLPGEPSLLEPGRLHELIAENGGLRLGRLNIAFGGAGS